MGNSHVKLYEILTSGKEMFKDIFVYSSDCPFVQWTGTICTLLEKGIMRSNPVKLF